MKLSLLKSILRNASNTTVIHDGAVRYAVDTLALSDWEKEHGDISGEKYDDFCSAVPYLGSEIGTPGNTIQNRLCSCLLQRGADSRRF